MYCGKLIMMFSSASRGAAAGSSVCAGACVASSVVGAGAAVQANEPNASNSAMMQMNTFFISLPPKSI